MVERHIRYIQNSRRVACYEGVAEHDVPAETLDELDKVMVQTNREPPYSVRARVWRRVAHCEDVPVDLLDELAECLRIDGLLAEVKIAAPPTINYRKQWVRAVQLEAIAAFWDEADPDRTISDIARYASVDRSTVRAWKATSAYNEAVETLKTHLEAEAQRGIDELRADAEAGLVDTDWLPGDPPNRSS